MAIYVRDDILSSEISDEKLRKQLCDEVGIEQVWCSLQVGCIYRSKVSGRNHKEKAIRKSICAAKLAVLRAVDL